VRRSFSYRSWIRIAGSWFAIVTGLAFLVKLLIPIIRGEPVVLGGEYPQSPAPASPVELAICLVVAAGMALIGGLHLLYAYRAEVVVEPNGFAAYGFGINPVFHAGWHEVTGIRQWTDEGGSWMRIRKGRRKVDLNANIADFDELRRIIESSVPAHVPRT
jgi:hypothetical protein